MPFPLMLNSTDNNKSIIGGLIVVTLASAATLAIKSAVSPYLGTGDIVLALALSLVLSNGGYFALFVAKAAIGGLLFTTLYFAMRRFRSRIFVSVIIAVSFMVIMSLGGGPIEF